MSHRLRWHYCCLFITSMNSTYLKRLALAAVMMTTMAIGTAALPPAPTDSLPARNKVKVSLVTFYPGDEVFSIYGHTELRVVTGMTDSYFNYGVFDFRTPNFVARFVAGETDYMCSAYPQRLATVGMEGRRMIEQDLNLTPRQARRIQEFLFDNAIPGNNTYRYKFLSDNCSTRPRDIIEMALGSELHYNGHGENVTYRDILSRYTKNYAWDKFGIDLALGSALDTIVDYRQQMFIPMVLMQAVDSATVVRDGIAMPLVSERRVMVDGDEAGTVLPPTPWYLTPLCAAIVLLVVTLAMAWRDWRRQSVTRWYHSLVATLYAIGGCFIFFLIFISTHEATSPNWNALWLNPLYFIPAVLVWRRHSRVLRIYHIANAAVLIATMVLWPVIPQVANTAFFPLMMVPVVMAASYLAIERKSAKNQPVSSKPSGKPDSKSNGKPKSKKRNK